MRIVLALAVCAALAACGHGGPSAPAPGGGGGGKIGYVRMSALIEKHPLYGQLAEYDANIAALDLSALVPRAVAAGPQLAREQAALQRQLQAAAARTNALLATKGKRYQDRENAAIAAALRQASAGGGTSVGAIRSEMEATAQGQVHAVASQAERDLDAYRRQLTAQDAAQLQAAGRTLAARAERTYEAEADDLNAKESALSLQLASEDAATRLSLHAKLATLALDPAQRSAIEAQLGALDRKASDASAAQRAQDRQALVGLQTQLRSGVQAELDRQVAQVQARSRARYQARARELRSEFAPPTGPLIAKGTNGEIAQVDPNLPPALRTRIDRLHADYTRAFQRDARSAIAKFERTKADLTRRYDALDGVDAEAARSAQREIAALQKKRATLYAQMVAQIDREVKTIAQQRGIAVVVSDVAAPAGGVDLTDAAMKEIETLHE